MEIELRLNKTDKDKLPESAFEPRELKVKDLHSGIGAVDITVRIVEIKKEKLK